MSRRNGLLWLACCAGLLAPLTHTTPAAAQPDPATVAADCLTEIDRAQAAVDVEDTGRAMVLVDMARDPCATARQSLLQSISEFPDASALAVSTLWQMELRRARLYTALDQCEDARRILREVAAGVALPPSVELEFARIAHGALACGSGPGTPSGGTLAATPGMYDIVQSGRSVGVRDASTLTDYCYGWIPEAPNFNIEVSEAMQLSMSAYSYEGGDLMLYLTGPGGTFCNDDYDGLNPGISEFLAAGTYQVFIGEYTSSTYGTDFTLTLSTSPLYVGSTYTYPTYGEVWAGPGYGRTTLSGSVWGYREAATAVDPTCAGWIAENPDFRLYIDSPGEAWITVTGAVGTDLTLVMTGGGVTYCNDDSSGTNPVLHQTFPAGTYDIWVGDKVGASTGATYGIQFAGYDPLATLETTPAHGTASVGPGIVPTVLSGSTSGGVPATDFFGSSCYGTIGTAPSHRMTVTADSMVEVVARATAYGDLVLVVSGPSGTFCNDDYESLNPGIRRWLAAGDYLVYVGELGTGVTGTAFTTTFSASTGTPPPDLSTMTSGVFGSVTLGYAYGSSTLSGTSGGPRRADEIDMSCHGFISEQPSFLMDVSEYSYVSIRVLAEGDTTLVVLGPDGVVCNDDLEGLNPGLQQYLNPGRYGVWVGSYGETQASPFMISFSPGTGW